MDFKNYTTDGFYDELIESDGSPRAEVMPLVERINALPNNDLRRRQKAAERALYQQGITFRGLCITPPVFQICDISD
jgi:uncharacterized circularly permuted ATP-grasp superfamily protein